MSETIDRQARRAASIAFQRAEEAALTGGAGDLDIQADVTGSTLTVAAGNWYPLTNATSCAITLNATLADERSAVVEARVIPSGNYTLTAAATFSLNGTSQGSVNIAKFIGAQATIVRAGTDFRVYVDLDTSRNFGGAPFINFSEATQIETGVSGAKSWDFRSGAVIDLTLSGAVTSSAITNVPVTTRAVAVTFIIRNTNGLSFAWPTGTKWPAGTPPSLSSGATDIDEFVLITRDAGSEWLGHIAGQDFS